MESQLILAQAYVASNNIDNAVLIYQEMIKSLSKSKRNNTVNFWLALVKNNLAKLYFSIGEIRKAGNYSAQAVQALSSIRVRDLSSDQWDEFYGAQAQCKANLALVYARLNNKNKCEQYHQEAMDSLNKISHLSEEDESLKLELVESKVSSVSIFKSDTKKKASSTVAVKALFK